MAVFQTVHPIVPVRDIKVSLEYYKNKLGFAIKFLDNSEQPLYAGITRGDVEIHLQWHQEDNWQQMNACSLRFVIEDIESLFEEYSTQNVFHEHTQLRTTAWGTQEFAFYDLDKNALTFYRDL